jgi:hypothetical protein
LNVEVLATFMVAIDRMAAVEDWAAERIAQVQGETDRRRQEQRESAGAAFHAMYARGEAVTTIA